MSGIEIGALCVVGAFLLFAAVRLFRGPVKLALRVLEEGTDSSSK